MSLFKKGGLVLFQGDSVTESGRDKNEPKDLGWGYPFKISCFFRDKMAELGLSFLNRGVSGDRAADLSARWDCDCIGLKPDVVSILVGVNDCWHRFRFKMENMPVEVFEKHYREILEKTKDKLPETKIVLLEPFIIPDFDKDSETLVWREDLDPKIHAIRRLAYEFDAAYIPLDGIFAAGAVEAGPDAFAADGIHPTSLGHALIADAWVRALV